MIFLKAILEETHFIISPGITHIWCQHEMRSWHLLVPTASHILVIALWGNMLVFVSLLIAISFDWYYQSWGSSWRTAAHGKDPLWSSSWETVSCGTNPTLEQGKSGRRKEQQRCEVTTTPIAHCTSWEVEEVQHLKVNWDWEEEGGESDF